MNKRVRVQVVVFLLTIGAFSGVSWSRQARPSEGVHDAVPIKDVSGACSAVMNGPMGSMEITYNLKVTNGRISGTAVTRFGQAQIVDGTIDGDNLHFTVEFRFFGISQRSEAKGRIAGDTLIITPAMPGPPPGMGSTAFKAEPLTFRRK
jgi:hypothetical protein